jgi:GDP-fucose transporter C1
MHGTLLGVLSSLFAALNSVQQKRDSKFVKNNLWMLNFWLNFNASIIFIPLIYIFNETEFILKYEKIFDLNLWGLLTFSGVLGFLVGYFTSLQIKVTSPLTHNISGTVKSYLQTLMGVIIYKEIKSHLWWIGNYLVLIGAGLYSHVRNVEMTKKNSLLNNS